MSKFQMQMCHVRFFDYDAPEGVVAEGLEHELEGEYAYQYTDGIWHAVIALRYAAKSKPDEMGRCFSVRTCMESIFTYQGEQTEEEEKRFVKMLKMNGALSLMAVMRGQVATTTTALGMSPNLIMPSVNLNYMKWTDSSSKIQNAEKNE